ncbi:hypothetical protein BJ875DRAFT_530825 [Amylocarpus encephaloides]|uniref:Uncharacterized protein n=1 Tax=Amylocarpus encephaloides TaxID=45428 RepID=A0A9P7YKL3_9HELO|nr:hypothetical protein BJ875DRAFT_530825 [Amylocarpus encephaloides]
MLLVFWVPTPFQSAIFTARTVQRPATVQMETSGGLVPIQDQINVLDVPFLHIAYGIAWLGQQLLRFTTPTHAMLPFQSASKDVGNLTKETWVASTEVFSTSLNCTTAITKVNEVSGSYTFDNGNVDMGSLVFVSEEDDPNYIVAYLGYPDKGGNGIPSKLESRSCSKAHSNNSLAIWADNKYWQNETRSNVTALFCIPNYHTSRASVTVNASLGAVVDVVEDQSTVKSLNPLTSIFNHSTFDYIIASGVTPRGLRTGPGILDSIAPETEYEVPKQDASVKPLRTPDKLHKAFEKAHRVMFAAAFSTLITPPDSSTANSLGPVTRKDAPGAIILVRTVSVIVEAVLAVIAILACLLWYNSCTNPLFLSSDPASIAEMMSVLPPNQELTYDVKHSEVVTSSKLQRMVGKARYRLFVERQGPPRLEKLSPSSEGFFRADSHFLKDQSNTNDGLRPILPKEHRLTVGAVFMILLSSIIATIISIEMLTSKNNGIRLSTSGSIARSMIENIAHTAFATFLEPVWIILNRLLCLLLPFEQLRRVLAIATSSVDAKYTSIPPQLSVWRALQAKHFLLAAACVATLSTNILAVSLAALFFEQEITTIVPFSAKLSLSPKFASTVYPFQIFYKIAPAGSNTVNFRADEESNFAKFFTSHLQENGTVIDCVEQRRSNLQFDGGFSVEMKPLLTATLDETTLQFDGRPIQGMSTI